MPIGDAHPHAERAGSLYWYVKTGALGGEEIWLWADEAQVAQSGALLFVKRDHCVVLALAPAMWSVFYAASVIDGSPIGVEHWDRAEEKL